MITFQEEDYDSLFLDIDFPRLLDENFNETGVLNTTFKLSPRFDMYGALAMQGLLQLYSAREAGVLVGFFISFLLPHQHYDKVTAAETDTFFISKEKRTGLTGYKFLKYAVRKLKQKADIIFLTTTIKRDLSKLLTRLDFKLTDYKYRLEV